MSQPPPTPREALGPSTAFGSLPPHALDELAAGMRPRRVAAGAAVVREGEQGGECYLVVEGQAEVWSSRGAAGAAAEATQPDAAWAPDPNRHVLVGALGPGDLFGEMAVLLGGARRATVRAATELQLYALEAQAFREVVQRHRGLNASLEEEMALRSVAVSLGKSSPFGKLDPEALRWVALRFQPASFEAGQAIIRQGEAGDAFYLLRSGRAEVVVGQPDGGEQQVATLGPGDPFGEQALLSDAPRSATVRALEAVEALRLERSDFQEVVRRYRDRAHYFIQLNLQRQRPRRIDDWAIERVEARGGETRHVLKDTRRNRYMKLTEQGVFLWELMDGEHTVRDLTRAYFARYRVMGLEAILGVILDLNAAGFVRIQQVDVRQLGLLDQASRVQRLLLALQPWISREFSLPNPDPVATLLYRLLRPLYTPPVQVALAALAVAGLVVFGLSWLSGAIQMSAFSLAGLVVGGPGAFVCHALAHEIGHAATVKHYGRQVHRAGVGWYLFLPTAYVDNSDMWLEPHRRRAAVAFAGPYANFLLAGLASLLLPFVADPTLQQLLVQFALIGFALGLMNLNPLIELDGYYILMDMLDVPNLRSRALAFLGTVLWGLGRQTRDVRQARVFAAYGVLTLAYTAFIAVVVLQTYRAYLQDFVSLLLPSLVATLVGWAMAGLMCLLILFNAWNGLRAGVSQARRSLQTEPRP